MPERISWSVDVSVENGPSVSERASLIVGAYDVVTITVPGADAPFTEKTRATVQPSAGADVQLLLIRSTPYDTDITFTVVVADGEPAGATDVPMDGPQLYLGQGTEALGGTAPLRLDFKNKMGVDNDATVTILVARDAS